MPVFYTRLQDNDHQTTYSKTLTLENNCSHLLVRLYHHRGSAKIKISSSPLELKLS